MEIVENYNIGNKMQDLRNPDFLGLDHDGKPYLIKRYDLFCSDGSDITINGFSMPSKIYELVSYSLKSKRALVRKISEKSMIEKIMPHFIGILAD